MVFKHKYTFTKTKLEFHARSSLGLCVPGVTEGLKMPLKTPLCTLRTT